MECTPWTWGWDALSAIGTVAAVFAAIGLTWSASRAQKNHAKAERKAAATRMALFIDHEFSIVEGLQRSALELLQDKGAPLPQVQEALGMLSRIHIPLTERFIDNVSCFEESIALQIGVVLTTMLQERANAPGDPNGMPAAQLIAMRTRLAEETDRQLQSVRRVRKGLAQYVNTAMEHVAAGRRAAR